MPSVSRCDAVRRLALTLLLMIGTLAWTAGAARAATVQTDCAHLGSNLAGANTNDTIVLTGLCSGANAHFILPSTPGLRIEGAAGTASGFDGTGVSSPAFATPVGGVDGVTFRNLTFKNYSQSRALDLTASGTASTPFVIQDDTFSSNTAGGNGGAVSVKVIESGACSFGTPAVELLSSSFSGNTATAAGNGAVGGGGGGAYIDLECHSGSISATVNDNTFTGNKVTANATGAAGGGLFIGEAGTALLGVPVTLSQKGNKFSLNSITASGSDYFGGGEFTAGANLTSVGDRFTANSIPGAASPSVSSEGAGLSSFAGNCVIPTGVVSSATNLTATGNTIGAPSNGGPGGEGAGVYVGCSVGTGGYHMTLINSTVTANSASGTGAVGGVDGETGDFLDLQNSIVFGNTGAQLGGFGSNFANLTADHSDVCNPNNPSAPFTGTGDICANPQLVNAAQGDVHETSASPTIDTGLNSDVPGSVTTDVYGNPRVQPKTTNGTPTVDMGAAEFHPAPPATTDCGHLQTLLDRAQSGDVITLAGMCTGQSFRLNGASDYTLQGAANGTNGFDGTGASNPALDGSITGMTIRRLTFQKYNLNGAAALNLDFTDGPLPRFDQDRFLDNTNSSISAFGGALEVFGNSSTCAFSGSFEITNSLFQGDRAVSTGTGSLSLGGGAAILTFCSATERAPSFVLSGNAFADNSLSVASGSQAYGAGLYLGNGDAGQLSVRQANNRFLNNAITSPGTADGSYNGAGEWLGSANLSSLSDRFSGNSLPGPSGATAASQGAGLGVIRGSCGGVPTVTTNAVLTNLVATGNHIGSPSAGGNSEGAGVYAGCAALQGTEGFHLTLVNSTLSGNSAPGGVAGVDGEGGDQLTLKNSIVFGDAGAKELGGFGLAGGGGSLSASFSDVCRPGTSTPLSGTGNLCANPKLAGVATADVHETASSPTIDAGSNPLVTPGTGADFYGQPRIVATKICTPRVDIGAAEFQTRANCPPPTTKVLSEQATSRGVRVRLRCTGRLAGSCSGTITLTTVETKLGSKVIAVTSARKAKKRKVTVTVGRKRYSLRLGKTTTVLVKLNRDGAKLLKKFGRMPVKSVVTQRVRGKSKRISTRHLTIRFKRKR